MRIENKRFKGGETIEDEWEAEILGDSGGTEIQAAGSAWRIAKQQDWRQGALSGCVGWERGREDKMPTNRHQFHPFMWTLLSGPGSPWARSLMLI